MTWQNRIVSTGSETAGNLLAHPDNWRIHPRQQQEGLQAVLATVGWVQDVIVNRLTGRVIDGHLRVTLALRQGEETLVPVKYVELTEDEERLVLTTLDPLGAMAATDDAKLSELYEQVQTDDPELQKLLASIAEENGLIDEAEDSSKDTKPPKLITCPECGAEFEDR